MKWEGRHVGSVTGRIGYDFTVDMNGLLKNKEKL